MSQHRSIRNRYRCNRYILIFSALHLIFAGMTRAQETGQISFHGTTFSVPSNWKGVRQNNLYLMVSDTEPGLIMIIPAGFTDRAGLLEELNREQTDGSSIWLSRMTEIEKIGDQALGAQFQGTFNFERTTMYVSGTVAEHQQGMMIYAGTSTELYSSRYRELSAGIIKSMHTTPEKTAQKPEKEGDRSNEWVQFYGNTRLSYIDSYYSSGYGDGSISGGYSNKIVIDLCARGYFTYRNDFEMSGGGNYSSFGSSEGQEGSGTWSIAPHSPTSATLQLTFYDGRTVEYTMQYDENGATFLNGDRFYRTTMNDQVDEHRPDCF